MSKKLILFFMVLCGGATMAYAADWKALHEKAAATNLPQAISNVALNPSSVDNLYILGLIYLREHQDQAAQKVFNKIVSLDPKREEARWGLGEVLRRGHKTAESEAIFEKTITKKPDFSPAYITLAYVKHTKGDFAQSEALAQSVIHQGKKNTDLESYAQAYLLLAGAKGMLASHGNLFSRIINGQAVLPNLKKAQRLTPNSPQVFFGLGNFYFLAPRIAGGNITQAENFFKKTVALDPLFTDAYVRLAQLYDARGDRKKTEGYLQKAMGIDPKNDLLKDFIERKCQFNCAPMKE